MASEAAKSRDGTPEKNVDALRRDLLASAVKRAAAKSARDRRFSQFKKASAIEWERSARDGSVLQ